MLPRDFLARLGAGWRPDGRDIAAADVIDRWQVIARGSGPYMLQGAVAGQACLAGILGIDARTGWALVQDRLLVLGERAPEVCMAVTPEDIMRRAAEAFDPPDDNRVAILAAARELAQRAQRAGLPIAGYLLEMAALEIENA